MKKNKWLLFVILVSIFVVPRSVLAYYNGSGVGTSSSGTGSCSSALSKKPGALCNYNNGRHNTVLVRLYYFERDGAGNYSRSIVPGSRSIILTSSISAAALSGTSSPSVFEVPWLDYGNVIDVLFRSVGNEITEMNEPYKSAMGINGIEFSRPSTKPAMNGYGYRIIIEPMLSVEYREGRSTSHAIVTAKEAARVGLTCNDQFHQKKSCGGGYHAVKLFTDTDDVGISRVACKGCDAEAKAIANSYSTGDSIREAVANETTGFGYNIVDIPDSWQIKRCYGYKVGSSKLPSCDRQNSGSFGFIQQVLDYQEVKANDNCPPGYSESPIYGKTVYANSSCRIDCLETATELFPGSYGKTVKIGDSLVWPTDSSHKQAIGSNAFNISFKGEFKCTVVGSNKGSCENHIRSLAASNNLSDFYKFRYGTTLTYSDGERDKSLDLECTDLRKANMALTSYYNTTTQYGENADVFTIAAGGISCKLPKNYNRYIDKTTNEVSNTPKSSNYVDIGYSNLRTSKNAKKGTYKLELNNIKLGYDNQYGSEANKRLYSCKYNMDDVDNYKCPEGTKHAGMDLSSKMTTEKITFAEAVEKYCDSGDSCVCPTDSDFAGADLTYKVTANKSCATVQHENCYLSCYDSGGNKHSCRGFGSLEDCNNSLCTGGSNICYTADGARVELNENNCSEFNSRSECIQHFCSSVPTDENPSCYTSSGEKVDLTACVSNGMSESECRQKLCKKFTCKNTNGVGGKMDITACVQTKVAQGLSLNEAIDACDMVVCPLGKKIIYRVIDLSNPFPSYNADTTVTQKGLKRGMFNDTLKGRYPGTNWNSSTIVRREILQNRNTDGDSVYNAKPMYVFKLDPNTLRSIRKYNKSTRYDDFNLKCKNNNSTACVSSFVHNRAYGLTGGTYAGSLTKDNFYSYDNKAG